MNKKISFTRKFFTIFSGVFIRSTVLMFVGLLFFLLSTPVLASVIIQQTDHSDSYGPVEGVVQNWATGINATLGSMTVAFDPVNCASGNTITLKVYNGISNEWYPKNSHSYGDIIAYHCTGSSGLTFFTFSFEFAGTYPSTTGSTGVPVTANCGVYNSNNCPWHFVLDRQYGGDYVTIYGENGVDHDNGAYFVARTEYVEPTCSDGIQNQDETGIDTGGACTVTISSDITTSTTWDKHHIYVVSGDVEIDPSITLTIEPGTRVKFDDTTSSSLTVSGTLNAIAEEFHEIVFSSSDNTPERGDWGGIIVDSGGEANFNYAVVTHAGAGTSEAGIHNDGGTISITNSDIIYSENCGIRNSSGTTNVGENSEVGFNEDGICKTGGTIIINDSVIHDNDISGIDNDTSDEIDAEDNYWGDPTGPDGFGPGSGDSVSDYVDFTPWKNSLEYTDGPGSVDGDEIRWGGSTEYDEEFDAAVGTWNDFGDIDILPDTIFTSEDLTVSDVPDRPDLGWVGLWTPNGGADDLKLNKYYMDQSSYDEKQNVITHELGHALGLLHSYTGNIMYFMQTDRVNLGPQDESDYNSLWH